MGDDLKEYEEYAEEQQNREEHDQRERERTEPAIKEGKRASEVQIGGEHYKDMRIQPTMFIEQNKLGWCEGNAVKYICRHKAKGQIKDIEKAIHYLDLLLEQEYCYVRTANLTA